MGISDAQSVLAGRFPSEMGRDASIPRLLALGGWLQTLCSPGSMRCVATALLANGKGSYQILERHREGRRAANRSAGLAVWAEPYQLRMTVAAKSSAQAGPGTNNDLYQLPPNDGWWSAGEAGPARREHRLAAIWEGLSRTYV